MAGSMTRRCLAPTRAQTFALVTTSYTRRRPLWGERVLRYASSAPSPRQRPDPHRIGVTRSWETVSAVMPTGGVYDPSDLLADACIRNLIRGVFPSHKHLVIRRKENTVTISFYIKFKGLRRHPPATYFLTGFVETLLTHWLGARVCVDVRAEPDVDKQLFIASRNSQER